MDNDNDTARIASEEETKKLLHETGPIPAIYVNSFQVLRDDNTGIWRMVLLEQTPVGMMVRGVFAMAPHMMSGFMEAKGRYDKLNADNAATKKKMN